MIGLLFVMALASSLVAAMLRRHIWERPQSRPMTIALAALTVYAAIRHPDIGNGWLDPAIATATGFYNVPDLLSDLAGCVAVWGLCTHIAQAWGSARFAQASTYATATLGFALSALYALSDATRTDVSYIGHLGGMATVYSYLASAAVTGTNAAVLWAGVLAQKTATVLLLLAASTVGVIVGIHWSADHYAPALADSRDTISWSLTAVAIGLYAAAAIVNLYTKARDREPMHFLERV